MCNQATNKDTVCKVGIQIPPNLLKSNVLVRVYSYIKLHMYLYKLHIIDYNRTGENFMKLQAKKLL